MTAKIVPFPGLMIQRAPSRRRPKKGVAFGADQRGFPCGNVVEIVRLDRPTRQNVDALQHLAARHLGVNGALDPADKALVDADLSGDPSLRLLIDLAPLGKLHRLRPKSGRRSYVTPSYSVNGHCEREGAQYATVAYIFVMHPGNRLRQLRKGKSLTQAELAERTGFAQDRISNYENGRRPMRLQEMRVLARELGCSPADLLDDADNPERLSEDERHLLQAFRDSPASARDFLLTSAQAVAERRNDYRGGEREAA